jgi:hypothetical protein
MVNGASKSNERTSLEKVGQKQLPGSKLMPKTKSMIFIGYSDKFKAWKCFDGKNLVEVYSSDVIFDNETINVSQLTNSESLLEHMHFSPDIHSEETAANAQKSTIVENNKSTDKKTQAVISRLHYVVV